MQTERGLVWRRWLAARAECSSKLHFKAMIRTVPKNFLFPSLFSFLSPILFFFLCSCLTSAPRPPSRAPSSGMCFVFSARSAAVSQSHQTPSIPSLAPCHLPIPTRRPPP